MSASERLEDLLRELAPQVLGVLLHRYGGFEECEDAVQEALLAAAMQWPAEGVPESPRSWLVTVASRRLIDQVRSEQARRRRRPPRRYGRRRTPASRRTQATKAPATTTTPSRCCSCAAIRR
ncbi:sigma factor [Nonomuraea recticatena]|uniref:sigma factor n=1 Tax=Nonomuraea recticatena TaxID=46178 RepID=UPI00361A999E